MAVLSQWTVMGTVANVIFGTPWLDLDWTRPGPLTPQQPGPWTHLASVGLGTLAH